MFVNLEIPSLGEILRIFSFSFCSRVNASHNQLISTLCSAHCTAYSKLWAWWNGLYHIYSKCHYLSYTPASCKFILIILYVLLNCFVMMYVLYIVLICYTVTHINTLLCKSILEFKCTIIRTPLVKLLNHKIQ